ncbi:MAG: hypothetical protein ABI806_28135 [Candidatus Solibacter sp.]
MPARIPLSRHRGPDFETVGNDFEAGHRRLRGFQVGGRRSQPRRGDVIPCIRVASGAVASNLQLFDNFTLRTRLFRNWSDQPVATAGEVHFGLAGLIGFDTARVNAFCPDDPTSAMGSSPCEVTLIFHDTQGRILRQVTTTLQPGTGGSLDFRTTEAGLPARRGEIVPCIRVARGAVVSSVELFDTLTGLTIASMHAAAALAP